MVDHEYMLDMGKEVIDNNEKLENFNLSLLLWRAVEICTEVAQYCVQGQDYGLDMALDQELIMISKETLEKGIHAYMEMPITNVNRAFGTMPSHEVTKIYNMTGLPTDMILVK